jgi:hypothetical protein
VLTIVVNTVMSQVDFLGYILMRLHGLVIRHRQLADQGEFKFTSSKTLKKPMLINKQYAGGYISNCKQQFAQAARPLRPFRGIHSPYILNQLRHVIFIEA